MTARLDLADYTVLEEFKGNSSNKIFLVSDRSGRKMIYKRIKIRKLQTQLREIQAQKALKHEYVVRLLEYEIQKQHIVLLIEYATGGDLFEFINNIESIRESKLLRLFYKIVIAVHFIHLNGFIHRDIKPENVLISGDSPKLADFGSSVTEETARNTFCGTYEYMAPEIYFRQKHSFKVDIWALGVLLFEMTHNRTPFKGMDVMQIKNALETKTVDFDAQISGKVRRVVYAMLKFDAKERPTTAQILKMPELTRFYKELKSELLKIYNDKSIRKIRKHRSQLEQKNSSSKDESTSGSSNGSQNSRTQEGVKTQVLPVRPVSRAQLPKPSKKTESESRGQKKFFSNKTARSIQSQLNLSRNNLKSRLKEKTDMNQVLDDSPYTSLEGLCEKTSNGNPVPGNALGSKKGQFRLSGNLEIPKMFSSPALAFQFKTQPHLQSKGSKLRKQKREAKKIKNAKMQRSLANLTNQKRRNVVGSARVLKKMSSLKRDSGIAARVVSRNLKKPSMNKLNNKNISSRAKSKNHPYSVVKAGKAQMTRNLKQRGNQKEMIRNSINLKPSQVSRSVRGKVRSYSKQPVKSVRGAGMTEDVNDYNFFTPKVRFQKLDQKKPTGAKRKIKIRSNLNFVPSPRKLARTAKNYKEVGRKMRQKKSGDSMRSQRENGRGGKYLRQVTDPTHAGLAGGPMDTPLLNVSSALKIQMGREAGRGLNLNPEFSLSSGKGEDMKKTRSKRRSLARNRVLGVSCQEQGGKGVYSSKNLQRYHDEPFQTFFGFDQMAYS